MSGYYINSDEKKISNSEFRNQTIPGLVTNQQNKEAKRTKFSSFEEIRKESMQSE